MPQDRGLASIALAMARQAARRIRLADEAERTAARETARREAEAFRATLRAERDEIRTLPAADTRRLDRLRRERELFVRERQHEASEQAGWLQRRWRELERILADGMTGPQRVYLDDLRLTGAPPSEPPPEELLRPIDRPAGEPPPREERGRGLAALMPHARHVAEDAEADAGRPARQSAFSDWAERERRRLERLIAWEVEQESGRESFLTKQLWRDREIEAIGRAVTEGDADAIATYVALTLERSVYPDGIERRFEIGFDPASGHLVVDLALPGIDAVPPHKDIQYIQSTDTVVPVPVRPIDRRLFHQNLVSAVALRALHEIAADLDGLPVTAIGLNGFSADPSSGEIAHGTCLVSVLASPADVAGLTASLRSGGASDPRLALRSLGAALPRSSDETPSVRPLAVRPAAPLTVPALDAAWLRIILEALSMDSLREAKSAPAPSLLAFDDHPVLGGKVLAAVVSETGRVDAATVAAFLAAVEANGAVRGLLFTAGDFDLTALDLAATRPVELIDGEGLTLLHRRLLGD